MAKDGTHNVYVVELDKDVLKYKKFLEENPDHEPGKACFYVGMTGLDPDERLENHKKGYKSNRFVRKYGKWLRRRVYRKYNPMSYDEALKKEVQLAEELRAEGHAVWQR